MVVKKVWEDDSNGGGKGQEGCERKEAIEEKGI